MATTRQISVHFLLLQEIKDVPVHTHETKEKAATEAFNYHSLPPNMASNSGLKQVHLQLLIKKNRHVDKQKLKCMYSTNEHHYNNYYH